MLSMEMVTVYSENSGKYMNTLHFLEGAEITQSV
jgi:hypothetical protein